MLNHSQKSNSVQKGFTLVELLVVISLVAIIFITFSSFFTNYLILYTKYQKDSSSYTELAHQSQRVSDVLRGLTDIVSLSDNDIVAYAYFSPVDAYVSQVRYYLNPTKTALYVDVIPMTANPPNGTLLTANQVTYKIISDFYQPVGGKLFTYYDATGTELTVPVADQHTVLSIRVDLAAPGSHTQTGQNLSISVSLRNRKTNL